MSWESSSVRLLLSSPIYTASRFYPHPFRDLEIHSSRRKAEMKDVDVAVYTIALRQ